MPRVFSMFQAVPKHQWPVPSTVSTCAGCIKAFGLFRTPNNCHGCGRVCCSECLAEHVVLPGEPGTRPVPVCSLCAKAVMRTHEEAEMAMHRCQLLEEMLNEQVSQAEKLRNDMREQQEENKLLIQERESLKATIARMEIEADVAAGTSTLGTVATAAHSPLSSSLKADGGPCLNAGDLPESVAAMEEAIHKKQRQLDLREATLKDALKKVSADAAKIVEQRAAFQEQEKRMTAQLTAQFTSLFNDERQRLEDICVDAVTDVQNKYMEWVAQQQDSALRHRRMYEQMMEERQQRALAEMAELRAERDGLQQALESQRARLEALQKSASVEEK